MMDAAVWNVLAIVTLVLIAIGGTLAVLAVRSRNMQLWLGDYYFRPVVKRASTNDDGRIDVFIAICDHFEPEWRAADKQLALSRVDRWCDEYPKLFSRFGDSRGRVPQHTFFFPQDQYAPEYIDRLAALCRDGFGDVDVHLHHDNDTEQGLRDKLEGFRETLFHRHGLLRRDPGTGEIVYGFIHGNWALCNSRPDRRWCGVNNEITVLRETGCYADFTMPSAPADTQTQTINSIYYAADCPGRPKSHDRGAHAETGIQPSPESLLMIQGPLMLDWTHRRWGVMPRIENGDLHAGRPPSWQRMQLWLNAGIHVAGKPNWRFVKLHTHGAKDGNIDMLLSEQMQTFHMQLAEHAQNNSQFRFYYVTAWEMAQLVHQAENGAEQPEFEAQLLATAAV